MNAEVKNPAVPRSSFKLHRFLFSLLAAISMLLCVATVGLWVRSYSTSEVIEYGIGGFPHFAGKSLSSGRPDHDPPQWARGLWHDGWHLESHAGVIVFGHERFDVFRWAGSFDFNPGWRFSRGNESFRRRAFGFGNAILRNDSQWFGLRSSVRPASKDGGFGFAWDVKIPDWAIVGATSVLPSVAFASWQRKRRRPVGCCTKCGYDLRATPERCPECGAEPKNEG